MQPPWTESGPKPYKTFLADVCNWRLPKRRLLEELEEQVTAEKEINRQLFPNPQQREGEATADGGAGDGHAVHGPAAAPRTAWARRAGGAGRGLHASATMSRLRTAVRAFADIDLMPDDLLTHLNDVIIRLRCEEERSDGS